MSFTKEQRYKLIIDIQQRDVDFEVEADLLDLKADRTPYPLVN